MKTTYFESRYCGHGTGSGDGNGYGNGYGNGDGYGNGNGDGYGYGNGYSNGNGRGYGYGSGYGYGDGNRVILLSPVFAYHIIAGDKKHASENITPEHAYNAGENITLCSYGLHASLKLEDARKYAIGTETKVRCSGRIMYNNDKLVCEHREVIEVL